MAPELLDKICAKAVREFRPSLIDLYNWSEPFLHPRLAEMIRVVKRHGLAVNISSNLNISRNMDKVLAMEPREFKVSVSGFDQENYGKTHKRGQIDRVKANMARLADLKTRLGSSTKLKVGFHRYLGNHEDEAKMKAYAEGLGFSFETTWAFFMPAEKYVALGQGGLRDERLNDADREIIDRLALDPLQAIEIAKKHKNQPCRLLTRSVSLTHTGDVTLCCSTYDTNRFVVGNFVDEPFDALQKLREQHRFCRECMEQGGHVLGVVEVPAFQRAAVARVRSYFPQLETRKLVKLGKKKELLPRVWRQTRNVIRNIATYALTWR